MMSSSKQTLQTQPSWAIVSPFCLQLEPAWINYNTFFTQSLSMLHCCGMPMLNQGLV